MCTKRRFSTNKAALLRIAEIKTKGEIRERTPIRSYYCHFCCGYHLTSQEKSKSEVEKINKRK